MATWQASAIGVGFAIIGAIVGTYLGGQGALGAQMGMSLGMAVGGAVGGLVGSSLYPDRPDLDKVPPPQPGENRVQVSSYGSPRGRMFGTVRKAGCLLKMQPIQETQHRTRGRENGVRFYRYELIYTSTFMIGFGPGPAIGISRLWCNGQIFYDARDPSGTYYPSGSADVSVTNLNRSVDRAEKYFTVYLGTETQEPDADLVAIFGASEVPAYRGEICVKFKDFPVGEYYGIPLIEAEIVMDGSVESEDLVYDFTTSFPGLTHHQAIDDDGNLIKYDSVSGRVVIFNGLSNVMLSSFIAPNPSGFEFRGLGFDPNTGLIIIGYGRTGSDYDTWARHYVVNTSGAQVTNWDTHTSSLYTGVYGTGGAGIFYAFNSDGMVVHYSTAAFYYFSWSYGSLMVLYEGIYGTEVDRVWGPNTTADVTSMGYAISKPVWADIPSFGVNMWGTAVPDFTPYIYLGDGSQYWKFRWSDLVKYTGVNTFTRGTMPNATLVSQSILNTRSGYAGALTSPAGDLLTYDTTYDELYIHSGITDTVKTRLAVLESGAGLDDVVADICAEVGISSSYVDVTALAPYTVLGYQIPRVMSARTALETLMRAYSFIAAEVDWELVFRLLGGSSVATIPDGDLGAAEGEIAEEQPFIETRSGGDIDLPSHLILSYESKARDYQTSAQSAYRADRPLQRVQNESLGLVMQDGQAKKVAEILLKRYWNRSGYRTTLPPYYNWLAPGDVITVRGKNMSIDSMSERGAVIAIECRAEPGGTYESPAEAQDIAFELVDISTDTYVPTVLLFDVPTLSVDHGQAGCYAAMFAVAGYNGGRLQRSADGGITWQDVAYFDTTPALVGQCTAALGTGLAGLLDYTAGVAVDMARSGGELASATDEELAAGANLAAIGSETDGYEIIQFKTAAESDGVYTLTGLLRGLYGTENKMDGHAAYENFVLLDDLAGIEFAGIDAALVGTAYRYRAVSPSGRAGTSFEYAATLLPIQPLPCASVRAGRNASGDVVMAWARADRYEFAYDDFPDNRDVPMSEVSEAYEIDILNPVTLEVIRTIEAASRTASYTQAQQTADGYPALVVDDDCAGTFGTNFTDNDTGSSASTFTDGVLRLYAVGSSGTSGANATASKVLNRQGQTVIGLRWNFDTAATELIEDYSTEIVVHKSSPTFATAAWSYGRPEHGVGNNSYLALAYHYSSGFYVTVVSRISGTQATVAQVAVTATDGQWVDIIWQIDWTAHTVTVWMDGVVIIDAAAFSSSLDAQVTSALQVTFRGNHYSGNYYYMDDIKIAHNMSAAGPVLIDLYQMSDAAGRGQAARVSI